MGRSTGYGLIDAAAVAANVPSEGQRLSISHLRALAPLDPDGQRELAPAISELTVAEARRVIRDWRKQNRRLPTRPTSATASLPIATRR